MMEMKKKVKIKRSNIRKEEIHEEEEKDEEIYCRPKDLGTSSGFKINKFHNFFRLNKSY